MLYGGIEIFFWMLGDRKCGFAPDPVDF